MLRASTFPIFFDGACHERRQHLVVHGVGFTTASGALGFIFMRGKRGFEAFDADQVPLGIFPSQREAAAAIMRVER